MSETTAVKSYRTLVESLGSNLSRKIWQKIMMIEQGGGRKKG